MVILNGEHTGPVQCVQFNPKYMMLATACSNMVSTLQSLFFSSLSSAYLLLVDWFGVSTDFNLGVGSGTFIEERFEFASPPF